MVTGEQFSDLAELLRWASFSGLLVVEPTEDQPWFEVSCLTCGASFAHRQRPWRDDAVMDHLESFVARHTVEEQ